MYVLGQEELPDSHRRLQGVGAVFSSNALSPGQTMGCSPRWRAQACLLSALFGILALVSAGKGHCDQINIGGAEYSLAALKSFVL